MLISFIINYKALKVCSSLLGLFLYRKMRKGMGSHQSAKMLKDEWLTPPDLLKKLNDFDLDPCSPKNRPWDTAKEHYTIADNGLEKDWFGRVFCNPPYGIETSKWLKKLSDHGNGIALIFARTETKMFFESVWNNADSILFIKGRLYFYHLSGEVAKGNAGAPSCLIAYGEKNSKVLEEAEIKGKFIKLKK